MLGSPSGARVEEGPFWQQGLAAPSSGPEDSEKAGVPQHYLSPPVLQFPEYAQMVITNGRTVVLAPQGPHG